MNKTQKAIISMLVLSILAISCAASLVSASGSLPFQNGQLVTANTLNIAGSSTVGPIAQSEKTVFSSYWNNLVALPANSAWGTTSALDINTINIATLGSGTAVPALTSGAADIGEMSRPPASSAAEWQAPTMTSMQTWAIGIDSVAIVVSPDMGWFPTNLNTAQVSALFSDTAPFQNAAQPLNGATGTTPVYNTWGDFLMAYYGVSQLSQLPTSINGVTLTSAIENEQIQRAVRDPSSGTYDCFNNYFGAPNGYSWEFKVSGTATYSQNLAPYTYCQENSDIQKMVSQGNIVASSDAIGFISLGYLLSEGNMIGLNIAYNMANPPSGQTISPIIKYYGPSGTIAQNTNPAYPGYAVSWGTAVVPTKANVIWAYSGSKGATATGKYEAWRYLWEVTPATIPSTGPLLATGVWISYMRAYNTTQSGKSDFVNDNAYIEMNLADYTGAHDIDSNLVSYNPTAGQTQMIPSGGVGSADFFYFVNAYIAYYTSGTYNPYADVLANGHVNSADFFAFVNSYIAYFTTYNPA